MSTISSVRVGVRPPWTVARVSTHHLILGGMVATVLLLYAHTLLRYGHAMHTTDGYMYYTHARSWYFDQDCDYENDLRLTPATFKHNEFYLGWRSPTGKVMNVFPCAWSVIALPFVALADLFTILHNAVWGAELPRDGYSTYYQLVVPLAHVLTGVVGLLLTFALLSWYFSNTIAALATAATWCGTNAAYYISFDPTMPHAASMTFVAGTIWSADTIRREGWSRLRALALGLCCGMMIGVRHHNVTWMVVPLIMLVPDLVRGIRSRRPGVGRDVGLVVLAAGTAFLSLLPQIVVNLASQGAVVGHVAKWTPQWFEVRVWPQLFSPTTGLLAVYPLAAVALVGLIAGLWSRRACAPVVALVVGLAAIIYLNAAYPWCPSPRRYVCAVAVLAWGLAVVMQWAGRSRGRTALVTVLLGGLCVQSLSMLLEPAGKFF